MHLQLAFYQYLDGSIEFCRGMINYIGAAAGHSTYAAVAIGYPIDRPLTDKIRGNIRGRCNIAAVLLYHDGLIDGQTAGLPRHDLPGRRKYGNTILESVNGKMTDIQADSPFQRIVHTMPEIPSPYMIAVLVSNIQKIGKVIAHLVAGIMKSDGSRQAEFCAIGQQVISQADTSRQLAGDRLNADIGIGRQSSGRYGELKDAVRRIKGSPRSTYDL